MLKYLPHESGNLINPISLSQLLFTPKTFIQPIRSKLYPKVGSLTLPLNSVYDSPIQFRSGKLHYNYSITYFSPFFTTKTLTEARERKKHPHF